MKRLKTAKILSFLFVLACVIPLSAANKQIMDGTFLLRSRHEVLDAQLKAKIASDKEFASQHKAMARISRQMVEGSTVLSFQAYNFATGQYDNRDATLKAVGQHCYVFLANDSSSLIADQAKTIGQIRQTFDEKIYPTCVEWFGSVSPPPAFNLPDDKIYILLLDIRDGLGGGYVAGYFDSRDLEGELGNRKPLFFMDLNPGKTGEPTDKTNDFYRTIAHEFQHMINFSKHLPASGRVQEDRWVEEGLSGFSEYLYTSTVGNDGLGLAPSPHLAKFLENPNLVLTQNTDSEWFTDTTLFRHYGASFLFIYYIAEKFGGATLDTRKAFLRAVVDNPTNGANGLSNVFASRGTSFAEVMKNWLIANHLNDPSLNNGLWGYLNKSTNLGNEAAGLPIAGSSHTFSGSGLSFIGGEGRIYSNAGKYEDIQGSGNLQLQFKGRSAGFTPFLATIDFAGKTAITNIQLDSSNTGQETIDLSSLKQAILVPAAITTQADVTDLFYYSFSGASSKVVVYPIPNPAFANEFIIVLKSNSGPISGTPKVSVTFNNIQDSPAMTPTDDNRTLFVANYTIPGEGQGVVSVTIGDVSSSFTFFSSVLKANSPTKLKLKDAEFSISSRVASENVYLYESALADIPGELQVISKPYFTAFNSKNVIEARLLFDPPIISLDRPAQVGLWTNQIASGSWIKVSQNERGFFTPISNEGLYVLVADKTAPKVHDLHIDTFDDRPTILARVSDGGSGINYDSIRIEVDGHSLPFNFDQGKSMISADLSRLPRGQHFFTVELHDLAENKGRAILSQVLSGPLAVVQVTAYPNPSKGSVNLAVILDGNGADDPTMEIEARIYDITGGKVINLPLSYKANRTFVARWDQRNEDNKPVGNGIYPFKVIIRKSGEELKATGKIAVLN